MFSGLPFIANKAHRAHTILVDCFLLQAKMSALYKFYLKALSN